jgi:Helix-turn-helix domain
MKRAVELFTFEAVRSSSAYVGRAWRTSSDPEPEDAFMSGAVAQWEIVVTRQAGSTSVTVRGPESRATAAPIPPDAEFFGISFTLGTFMPALDPRRLVDRSLTLPMASATAFWLHGSTWDLPGPANADVFVDRLVRDGLLVHDPVVLAALGDRPDAERAVQALSTRSVERRVARATGLTRGTIRQIRRADRAVEMLSRGLPAPEVARRAGYTDQPHLTRSLRRFIGQTPSEIAC